MTARTYSAAEVRAYSAAEVRAGFLTGWSNRPFIPTRRDAEAAALRVWPDPPPEPPVMTVREEVDPHGADVYWRWMSPAMLQVSSSPTANWRRPEAVWFDPPASTPARLALWADLAAYPMRLPDGRPCTLTGEAKP